MQLVVQSIDLIAYNEDALIFKKKTYDSELFCVTLYFIKVIKENDICQQMQKKELFLQH